MLFEVGKFTNSRRLPLFPDHLDSLDQADKLLPNEVIANLTRGDEIRSNKSAGRLVPYAYSPDFISAVAGFCLYRDTIYASEPFKRNIQAYIETFAFSTELYIFSSGPIQTERIALKSRGISRSNVLHDQDIFPPKRKKRVFCHGRSNGFPTPLGIRMFQLIKKNYPDYEVWFGVDFDRSSQVKGQAPFMDPQFRGSCYLSAKLVDKVVLLEPPAEVDTHSKYWQLMYSGQKSLRPDIIIIPNDHLTDKKRQDNSDGTKIIMLEELFDSSFQLFDQFHQGSIKNGRVSLEELSKVWRIIAEDLAS
ncbi:hypothetical protein A3C98_03270 [Candidatus Roizmanbacteria bacterium RIFCSPHIGHO2_02_FULL_37_15]|uniref:Uncharacterized protein n=1 Tax=Candidatus Roizmanbacteria bacterium RIFCSPLOWO2_01_FULL_37_16 TaxID=1802058 RepID=A0A1F7IJM5_9BACT|nr:MAG: hypothetical protein A2859_00785 [Candidatus Roizmanbacteria bacterium RIFCSPHIGHO2_01_FULL_37_16b]OGK22464.1 MAG: hypothetical protein A3C98_03270 [Candidatus Roizmanbacteria bacterium RIFCSPHIGHO2_02_FULL_37_15]OGK43556.1 MAG: hypothetical protein A3B40_00030 [Candidatus Roizmanbacteria bacterium RIFCSPLOWO2_01_FULL_37_16]OGK57549.1 MAG: hypothetical protein A3I50_05270 [Candidatus Roizmanbacteria bacterium RIFCSPLOWO2_02_FULL_37_9]